jgi:hypothetical protein
VDDQGSRRRIEAYLEAMTVWRELNPLASKEEAIIEARSILEGLE